MTLSYHDIRLWNSAGLDAAAETIKDRKERLLALEDELGTAFGPQFWHGDAATAARDRLAAIRDRAEHIVAEAGTVQRALWDAADAVILLKNLVLDADSTASANQFSIGADGSVTDVATAPLPPADAEARTALGDQLAESVGQILATAQEIDDALASVMSQAEAGEISDEGATTLAEADPSQQTADGHYRIGAPDRPDVQFDDDFVYDSADPGLGDQIKRAEWLAKLRAMEIAGRLPDAMEMYEHYWSNTGEPVEFDYDEAYRDDSGIRAGVDAEIARAAAGAEELIRNGNTSFPMTGDASTVAQEHYPRTENWQKAVGGYQIWSHADVRVEGNTVTMEITVEAEDRYNFNRGESDIATGTPDEENGRFAEVGWARPFDTHGELTRTVSWELGDPPQAAPPEGGDDEPRGRERERGSTPDNPRERGR